ncbi:MAG: 4-hydroxy-tetrahydrodipicolinate synthase [Clostridia bacterium]
MFKGAATAIITPFDDNNNINYNKLKELIDFQILNNIEAIVVCGTTGESSTLSLEEKKELIKFTVDTVDKRVKVIAGTGNNNTLATIELTKYAKQVNVDGVLLVTPYYNKCSKEGLYTHFKTIANNVDIPIILYNVPSRTTMNIDPEMVLRLSKIPNICGIKEASSDICQIAKTLSLVDKDFYVYSGNDDQIVPILSLGGMGVISVLSNVLPYETSEMCNSFFNNDIEKAKKLQLKYLNLINNLFIETNPSPIKEAMNILNYNVGTVRLPLVKLTDINYNILSNTLKELNI